MNNDLLHTQNEEQFIIEEQVQNVQVSELDVGENWSWRWAHASQTIKLGRVGFSSRPTCFSVSFQVDVIQINHIMRDIGAIVSEQSPIIAEIEQNVTSATDHIIAGNQQLSSAAGHQVETLGGVAFPHVDSCCRKNIVKSSAGFCLSFLSSQ